MDAPWSCFYLLVWDQHIRVAMPRFVFSSIQGFIRPGCTLLIIDLIVDLRAQFGLSTDGLTASERLVAELAALKSDPNRSPSGRPMAVARTLEALLGSAAPVDGNNRVVIQAGNQVP